MGKDDHWAECVLVPSMRPSATHEKVKRYCRCIFPKYREGHPEAIFATCELVLPGAEREAKNGKLALRAVHCS